MGVPGESALVMVANLTSSDAGAAMVKGLLYKGSLSRKQQMILRSFVVPGSVLMGMMVSYGVLFYPYLAVGKRR